MQQLTVSMHSLTVLSQRDHWNGRSDATQKLSVHKPLATKTQSFPVAC